MLCLRIFCPACIVNFLTSAPDKHVFLKSVLGFLFGILLAYGLYEAAISRMAVSEVLRYSLGGVFTIFLAVGYAISVQIRCTSLLIVPAFFGKSGRSYLGAFAVAFLLTGPVGNIIRNAHEITRSVGCSAKLAQNLTMTRLHLTLAPAEEVLLDLEEQAANILEMSQALAERFSPVESEIEDEQEVDELQQNAQETDEEMGLSNSRSDGIEEEFDAEMEHSDSEGDEAQAGYERKLDYRCNDIFSMAVRNCRQSFQNTLNSCNDRFPAIIRDCFCWPFRLSVLCNLINCLPGIAGISCNSGNVINEGLGNAYEVAHNAARMLRDEFSVLLQLKAEDPDDELYRKTGEEVAQALEYEFKSRQRWAQYMSDFVSLVTAFLFVRVLLSAQKYHNRYVTELTFDNQYLTGYFIQIDLRRKDQAKHRLLPLKKKKVPTATLR